MQQVVEARFQRNCPMVRQKKQKAS
jgi:hypothetical protein